MIAIYRIVTVVTYYFIYILIVMLFTLIEACELYTSSNKSQVFIQTSDLFNNIGIVFFNLDCHRELQAPVLCTPNFFF